MYWFNYWFKIINKKADKYLFKIDGIKRELYEDFIEMQRRIESKTENYYYDTKSIRERLKRF